MLRTKDAGTSETKDNVEAGKTMFKTKTHFLCRVLVWSSEPDESRNWHPSGKTLSLWAATITWSKCHMSFARSSTRSVLDIASGAFFNVAVDP